MKPSAVVPVVSPHIPKVGRRRRQSTIKTAPAVKAAPGKDPKMVTCSNRIPKPYYSIDTKELCILCFRERSVLKHLKPLSKKKREDFSSIFANLLMRHLKLDLQRDVIQKCNMPPRFNKAKVSVVLCEDCAILARLFCGIYSEMEKVNMRLNACVKNLSEIIRMAGRIPTRVKHFEKLMGVRPKSLDSSSVADKATKKSYMLARTLREEILSKAIQKNKNELPRVKLYRVEDQRSIIAKNDIIDMKPGKLKHSVVHSTQGGFGAQTLTQLQHFLLAYSISFAFVWSLAGLNSKTVMLSTDNRMVPFRDVSSLDIETLPEPTRERPERPNPFANPLGSTESISTTGISDKQPAEVRCDQGGLQEAKRNTITISDSGTTVLLPHQEFKIEDRFVDESIMEYAEESCDFMDIADDDFFTPQPPTPNNDSDSDSTSMQTIALKDEQVPEEINLNDRRCRDCKLTLSSRAELEKHRALIHKAYCYVECPACKQLFSGYYYLKRHRTSSPQCAISEIDEILEYETVAKPVFPIAPKITGNIFCPVDGCFEVFAKEEALKLHLKAHGPFFCNFCPDNRSFEKGHDLALHECVDHFGSNSYNGFRCSRCSFHVGHQYSLLLHFLDVHLKVEVYTERCEICKRGFSNFAIKNPENKDKHFKTHHDIQGKDADKVFICEICQAPFLKKSQLNEHEAHIHCLPKNMITCNMCGIEVISTTVLMRHKLIYHDQMTPHEVEVEMKRRAQAIQANQKKILEDRKFECGCGKAFNQRFKLKRHIERVHKGVAPPIPPKPNNPEPNQTDKDNNNEDVDMDESGNEEDGEDQESQGIE